MVLIVLAWGARGATAHARSIVYLCGADVCRVNADGGHRVHLTRDGAQGPYDDVYNVRDSRFVAFEHDRVYLADRSLRHRRAVAEAGPEWTISTDARHYVFKMGLSDQFTCFATVGRRGGSCRLGEVADLSWWRSRLLLGELLFAPHPGVPQRQDRVCAVAFRRRAPPRCVRVLARGPRRGWIAQPDLSPDGRLLVAVAGRNGRPAISGVTLFDAVTGRRLRVLAHMRALRPTFSPDGRRVVFQRLQLGPDGKDASQVWAVDLHGHRRLVARGQDPAWIR